jgi:YesN/AraC family two-component response regulator
MKHKMLIVDDEKSIRESVKTIFSEDFLVFTASEGKEAIEILKQERPVLVFLDITMPGLSGLDVLALIKETNISATIWMLTGEDNINIALKTIQMGATGYLTKPFNVSEIRKIADNVKKNCDRKGAHDTSGDKPWHVEKE